MKHDEEMTFSVGELIKASGVDDDGWKYNESVNEWVFQEDCDVPGWRVTDEDAPDVVLEWGDLTMRWCCHAWDLSTVMKAMRKAVDVFDASLGMPEE